MFAFIFRLIFWGMLIGIGTQADWAIFKMRDIMREKALKKMSEEWPPLWAAPKVNFKKYDSQIYRTKINPGISGVVAQAKRTYKVIKKDLSKH